MFTIICPAWHCKVGWCFVLEARGGPVWVSWPCSVCHGAGQEHTSSSEPPQACVWVSRSCSVRHGTGQKQALSLEPRAVRPCGLCFNAHNEVFIVQRCSSLSLDALCPHSSRSGPPSPSASDQSVKFIFICLRGPHVCTVCCKVCPSSSVLSLCLCQDPLFTGSFLGPGWACGSMFVSKILSYFYKD